MVGCKMKFKATTTTEDGRLTKGKVYHGQIVMKDIKEFGNFGMVEYQGIRIVVFDNKCEWMTFNPSVFVPYVEEFK